MSMTAFSPGALSEKFGAEPLVLAAHGGFWAGGIRKETPNGTILAGQMYVEYFVPADWNRGPPVVMIHGGGGQGTDYITTPDGRPGWAIRFAREGYAVYVVDRPGHGRAPFHEDALGPMTGPPSYEAFRARFTCPRRYGNWPAAELHTQWPGSGDLDDPALDNLVAGAGPTNADMARAQEDARAAGAALLDGLGPSILLTCSAGSPCGWAIADARPDLVRAIVAVEPLGPPFMEMPFGRLEWGLTSIPLVFDPPAANPSDLARLKGAFGASPPRLANLSSFPILIVTGEASWMIEDNKAVVDFLSRAGASVEHMQLADHGIAGNGHMMVMERNSDEIAGKVLGWLSRAAYAPS